MDSGLVVEVIDHELQVCGFLCGFLRVSVEKEKVRVETAETSIETMKVSVEIRRTSVETKKM
ncbi:hypothetical protein [Planococcus shixiaomingii]|uniref:hypothetical protein n=1 Tax=Planococcus shixiaomingii TaxID=3058393 RepID=UPI0026590830|nr:hypothetical protein [Planococcus sp. N028]